MNEEERLKRLGLTPDVVDRNALAIAVLRGDELEKHERMFIVRLLYPLLVEKITGQTRGRGRPTTTAAAMRDDRMAEAYFNYREWYPKKKHKEELAPNVAKLYGVSASYLDKVLKKLDHVRRAEMEADAKAHAEFWAWVQKWPKFMAVKAEIDARLRELKRSPRT
jgi:hypothetical protein